MATKTIEENESLRHLGKLMLIIISKRTRRQLDRRKEFIIGVLVGVLITTTVVIVFTSPILNQAEYVEPVGQIQIGPLPDEHGTQTELLDTELTGNFSSGFNFTGRFIANNQPVNTFECSFNNEPFETCGGLVTFPGLASGNYTFEARSALPNGTVDHTPAAVIGSVE